MKSKKILILILILFSSMIPEARAITPQEQTVKITDTHDDMFITEVGIGIDSSLVTIKDPGMDIRAFLVFRELDINYWEPLTNATLRLHTSNILSFDADSAITIYGMKLSDLQLEGFLLPSIVLNIGFTTAHINYNTSQFYGNNWFDIDVTDIIEELIRNPHWDGDGSDGTETGDAIGFHILGPEGDEKRYFYDFSVGNGLEAQLVIHWNHEPPPPSGYEDADFNSTYRGFEIWVRTWSNLIDLVYWNGTNEHYMEVNTNSTEIEIMGVSSQGNRPSSYQIIRGPEDDIFYLGRVGTNQTLFHSYDEGLTWENYTLNDQYAELRGNANKDGSLAFDSKGDLYVAWSSINLDRYPTGFYTVHVTNITIENHVLTFASSVDDIGATRSGYATHSNRPSLWIDGNDRKHITWDGYYPPASNDDHVFYRYKDSGAWIGFAILDNLASIDHRYSQIVISENGTFKLVVWEVEGDLQYAYFKTAWIKTQNLESEGVANNYGPHISYNDNEDKVLGVYEHDDELCSKIFDFSDLSLSSRTNVGFDARFPDLTFDINKSDALAVYDAGADGIKGIIYDFDNESWGSNFSIRDIDPGYIHTVSLGTIDIGGGETTEEWFAFDPETNTTYGPFDDFDDVIDFIDADPDPEDPAPPGWDETGPFTRFKTRLYFLILGLTLFFGPMFFFAYQRPSGYQFVIGLFIMFVGIAFLISVGSV